MSKATEKINRLLREGKIISDDVRRMVVNQDYIKENKEYIRTHGITERDFKLTIYKRYHINYYSDYEEFYEAMKEKNVDGRKIYSMWKQYQHRDELILSGQYGGYRIERYRENYIYALEQLGASDAVILNLRNLSKKEFKKLAAQQDFTNDNQRIYLLPQLGGGFNYHIEGIEDDDIINEVEEEIKNAFKESGLQYNEKIDNSVNFEPEITNKRLRRTLNQLTNYKASLYNNVDDESEYILNIFDLLKEEINKGKKIYKDHGSFSTLTYIGSSKVGSPNYKFVQQFRNYMKHK